MLMFLNVGSLKRREMFEEEILYNVKMKGIAAAVHLLGTTL